jgi:hypothetical protein
VLLIIAMTATICSLCLTYSIQSVKDSFDEYPNYIDCVGFSFENSTVADYTPSSNFDKVAISCFCRHNGEDTVDNDGDGNSSLTGIKSLCSDWSSDKDQIYYSLTYTTLIMLAVNLFISYGFKIAFSKMIMRFRNKTTNNIMTSILVFVFNSFFLGVLPSVVYKSTSMDRGWYLTVAVLHMWYFFGILIMHPLEIVVVYLATAMYKSISKRNAVLQKDISDVSVRLEFDYSHKIGRLLAHLFIVILLGPGVPLLVIIFAIHLLLF